MEIANTRGWRIASIERTAAKVAWIRWWGPDNGGYDDSLDHAGVYELDHLLADPSYYGRFYQLCVPDYVARRLAGGRERVKNVVAAWEALWLAALFRRSKPDWPTPYDPKPTNEEASRFNQKFPVGRVVRVVIRDRVQDVAVRVKARNVDDRAVVQLAGVGLVQVRQCLDPKTTCNVCGDDLLTKWSLEWDPIQYAGRSVGDCRSCPLPQMTPVEGSGYQGVIIADDSDDASSEACFSGPADAWDWSDLVNSACMVAAVTPPAAGMECRA